MAQMAQTAQKGAKGRNSAQKGANGRNSAQKGATRRIMALFKTKIAHGRWLRSTLNT
jgi:hypothetical protein